MIETKNYTMIDGVREVTIDGLTFVWHGGAYIDIFDPDGTATDMNINVWDYRENKATIEKSKRGFIGCCKRWYKEATA